MAHRTEAHGLTKEVQEKILGKYSVELEQEAMRWIEQITGKTFYQKQGMEAAQEYLKNGVLLCETMNRLQPNSIKRINTGNMAFKQMENISAFLTEAEAYGLLKSDLFQTVDLYEGQNMTQVIMCVHALGRKAQLKNFNGPTLGPKEAEKNVRNFDEETLNAGKAIPSQQAGNNKGATPSGQNFGKRRFIID